MSKKLMTPISIYVFYKYLVDNNISANFLLANKLIVERVSQFDINDKQIANYKTDEEYIETLELNTDPCVYVIGYKDQIDEMQYIDFCHIQNEYNNNNGDSVCYRSGLIKNIIKVRTHQMKRFFSILSNYNEDTHFYPMIVEIE